ncbi:hypothetical protein [Rubricoccus marinus]|uniref:Uncharacterized protein n=1 Tax=Rubricoccus marinus TaxID=716817 RepID=A0A259TWB4_9BACT|nr:hypothetical protein [Rubricoccus marinus]OZC01907.1 hypothetical protein BSZ36_02235 [Rubricoccus marinus]
MRCLAVFLVAFMLTGCASSRRAELTPPPVRLSEVNRALEGHRANVVYADGREPVRGFVRIGAEETTVVERSGENHRVPTADILRVELDASLTPAQGAGNGALYGAIPGLLMAGAGGISLATTNCDWCFAEAYMIAGGGAVAVLGAVVGTGAGALGATTREMVPVYEAPVTRYPDAALELLTAEPLAEPSPTATTAPEAAALER